MCRSSYRRICCSIQAYLSTMPSLDAQVHPDLSEPVAASADKGTADIDLYAAGSSPLTAGHLQYGASQTAASAGQLLTSKQRPRHVEAAPAREYSSPYHYDKLSTGSFPHRNFGCPHPVEELYNTAATEQETATAAQHPLGWVPVDENELGKPSSKCIDDEALAVESRLPLELFDSLEQELIAPEERLAAAGPSGIPAFSRYYTAAGSFTWAPCTVAEYSRWVWEHAVMQGI
jgi:hypothetical protein